MWECACFRIRLAFDLMEAVKQIAFPIGRPKTKTEEEGICPFFPALLDWAGTFPLICYCPWTGFTPLAHLVSCLWTQNWITLLVFLSLQLTDCRSMALLSSYNSVVAEANSSWSLPLPIYKYTYINIYNI